jgi:hypothetical protein
MSHLYSVENHVLTYFYLCTLRLLILRNHGTRNELSQNLRTWYTQVLVPSKLHKNDFSDVFAFLGNEILTSLAESCWWCAYVSAKDERDTHTPAYTTRPLSISEVATCLIICRWCTFDYRDNFLYFCEFEPSSCDGHTNILLKLLYFSLQNIMLLEDQNCIV